MDYSGGTIWIYPEWRCVTAHCRQLSQSRGQSAEHIWCDTGIFSRLLWSSGNLAVYPDGRRFSGCSDADRRHWCRHCPCYSDTERARKIHDSHFDDSVWSGWYQFWHVGRNHGILSTFAAGVYCGRVWFYYCGIGDYAGCRNRNAVLYRKPLCHRDCIRFCRHFFRWWPAAALIYAAGIGGSRNYICDAICR